MVEDDVANSHRYRQPFDGAHTVHRVLSMKPVHERFRVELDERGWWLCVMMHVEGHFGMRAEDGNDEKYVLVIKRGAATLWWWKW